jgi:hypothetical protein
MLPLKVLTFHIVWGVSVCLLRTVLFEYCSDL